MAVEAAVVRLLLLLLEEEEGVVVVVTLLARATCIGSSSGREGGVTARRSIGTRVARIGSTPLTHHCRLQAAVSSESRSCGRQQTRMSGMAKQRPRVWSRVQGMQRAI